MYFAKKYERVSTEFDIRLKLTKYNNFNLHVWAVLGVLKLCTHWHLVEPTILNLILTVILILIHPNPDPNPNFIPNSYSTRGPIH